jgi:hypothetical protein
LTTHFGLAEGQRGHCCGNGYTRAASSGVTHGDRAVLFETGIQHLPAFVFVSGCHDGHVGQTPKIGKIERPDMGCPVSADNAGAVDGEENRQVLYRDVVNQLIVGTLEKRRIDGDDRLHPFASESRRERKRVLLGDADIEIPIRIFAGEANQPRTLAHRRRDAHEAWIARGHVANPIAENLRIGRLPAGLLWMPVAGSNRVTP